jgi:hypothetical protein
MKRQLFTILAAAAAVTASVLVSSGAAAAVPDPTAASAQGGGGTPSNPEGKPIYVDPTQFKIVASLRGVGKQVYDCSKTTNPAGAYTLREPVAGLFTSRGIPAAIHGKGPFWASFDGSRVDVSPVTLPVPFQPDPTNKNIPWLKVTVVPVPQTTGVFSNVTLVQRVDTRGGVAPTPTSPCTIPSTVAVDYTANYVFWAPK